MHINLDGKFWVSETARNAFLFKIPQVYSGLDDQLHNATDGESYYRVTFAYFHKGNLIW